MGLGRIFPFSGQPGLRPSPSYPIFKSFPVLFNLAFVAFPLYSPTYIPAICLTNPSNASSVEISVELVCSKITNIVKGSMPANCFLKESEVVLSPCDFTVIWGLFLVFRLTNLILLALQKQAHV